MTDAWHSWLAVPAAAQALGRSPSPSHRTASRALLLPGCPARQPPPSRNAGRSSRVRTRAEGGGKGAARDAERREPEQRCLPWLPQGPAAARREGACITSADPPPPRPFHRRGHGSQRGTAACSRPHSCPAPRDCVTHAAAVGDTHKLPCPSGLPGRCCSWPLPASGGAYTPPPSPRPLLSAPTPHRGHHLPQRLTSAFLTESHPPCGWRSRCVPHAARIVG